MRPWLKAFSVPILWLLHKIGLVSDDFVSYWFADS